MQYHKMVDLDKYPIQPDNIDTSKMPYESFGKSELEACAPWVVNQCKKQGSWKPLVFQNARYRMSGFIERGYMILLRDDTVQVTHEFIATYFKAMPQGVGVEKELT